MLQVNDQRTTVQWAKALARAIDEALDVLIEPISGEAFVESATRPGVLYQVSASMCSCPAGQRGAPCKHRACYLAQIGELPLGAASEPEADPNLIRCGRCFGDGECWLGSHDDGFRRGVCPWCGGAGVLPVPGYGSEPFPAVRPVAEAA
jgi:hypothetical protein